MSRYRITPNYTSASWEATRREIDSMLARAGGQEREEGVSEVDRLVALSQGNNDMRTATDYLRLSKGEQEIESEIRRLAYKAGKLFPTESRRPHYDDSPYADDFPPVRP